jgi:hypothetical protein
MRIIKGARRRSSADVTSWLALGALGTALLAGVVLVSYASDGLNSIALGISIAVLTCVVFGLLFRWGPMIPFTIAGVVVGEMLTSSISRSPEEEVKTMFGAAIIGAIGGAILGALWEWHRNRGSK